MFSLSLSLSLFLSVSNSRSLFLSLSHTHTHTHTHTQIDSRSHTSTGSAASGAVHLRPCLALFAPHGGVCFIILAAAAFITSHSSLSCYTMEPWHAPLTPPTDPASDRSS